MEHLHKWLGQLQVKKSHYTRGKSPLRQYMEQNLTVKGLWLGYANKCVESDKEAVSESVFREVFNSCYNIVPR